LEVTVVADAVGADRPAAVTAGTVGFVAARPMLVVRRPARVVGPVRTGGRDVRRPRPADRARGRVDLGADVVGVTMPGFDAAGVAARALLFRVPPAAMMLMMTTAMAEEMTTFFTSVSFGQLRCDALRRHAPRTA